MPYHLATAPQNWRYCGWQEAPDTLPAILYDNPSRSALARRHSRRSRCIQVDKLSGTTKEPKNEKPTSQALWRWVIYNKWLKLAARDSAHPHQNARRRNRDNRRPFGVKC